ncbi:hypothetical protein RB653_007082 [Dictyostelium firmibasis]|uniref:Saposin B-type domain-containing protein n=1 Tax=Dictyostelium firmibasis TaxID=79012 RepID=A0AAN7YUB8_9MYCE
MNKLLLAFLFFGLIASVTISMKIDTRMQNEKNLQDIPLCLICSFAVDKIEEYLENKSNTTIIVDKVEKDCDLLKEQNWIGKCESLVAQYGPEIIQLLESNESPEACCKLIELC